MPKHDPDKMRGPGGLTLRELHELVKKSAQRDLREKTPPNKPAQKATRWMRGVRYVWDKRGRKG